MSESETPTNQHPAVRSNHDMTVTDYRLQAMEDSVRILTKEFKRFTDRSYEQDSATKVAIERCSGHGVKIDNLEKSTEDRLRVIHRRVDGIKTGGKRESVSFWTAVGAALSSAAAWVATYLHK